jgi:hypothetical protein
MKTIYCLLLLVTIGMISPIDAQTKPVKPLAAYNGIIVEAVTMDKNPRLAKFPAGHDSYLQKNIVTDLRKKNVFAEVIDGTRQSGEPAPQANIPASDKRLILSTTIIDFSPGNKALRYTIGWGTGATKVKARFILRDAATGREVMTHTQRGVFYGFVTYHGTGRDYPTTEASGDIVDGLIKTINKNR